MKKRNPFGVLVYLCTNKSIIFDILKETNPFGVSVYLCTNKSIILDILKESNPFGVSVYLYTNEQDIYKRPCPKVRIKYKQNIIVHVCTDLRHIIIVYVCPNPFSFFTNNNSRHSLFLASKQETCQE